MLCCALAGACDGPTSPSANGYAGEWSGTTAQGRPIAFTISPEQTVTAITIGHDFNGCSGLQTFVGLSIGIQPQVMCIPAPCPPSVSSYRSFGYADGGPLNGPSTQLHGLFPSPSRAEGSVNFRAFPDCGDAIGVGWAATRR
jgi:hypothetical protein